MNGNVEGLAWEERGDASAPPLLLIRPLGGSMELWGGFAGLLAASHRLVMFDARGVGQSTGEARTSMKELAADALSVLDARNIERAHVFGISLGGMVATRFVLDYPERVSKLVLASTAGRGLAFEKAGIVRGARFAEALLHEPAKAERALVRRVLSRHFKDEHPAEAERIAIVAGARPSSRSAILRHGIAALRHDARSELASILAPTLVLAGGRDHLLGPAVGRDLEHGIPNAERILVETAGHDLTLERPRETAEHVLRFLARP